MKTYLTQSPRTPFQIGRIHTVGNQVWGYSGMINYDPHAGATYDMLAFTLDKDAVLNFHFGFKGEIADTQGIGVGFSILIDGIDVIQYDQKLATVGWHGNFFLPAQRGCDMKLTNPSSSAALINANVSVIGELLNV